MLTVRATIKNGKIELLEPLGLSEGSQVLVTLLETDDFWLKASEESLKSIWGNPQDDIYAKILTNLQPNG